MVVVPVTEGSVPLRHPLAGLHGPLSSSVRLSFSLQKQAKSATPVEETIAPGNATLA